MIVIEAALQKRAFKQLQNTTEKFGKNFNTHFKTVLNRSIAEGVKQSVKNVKGEVRLKPRDIKKRGVKGKNKGKNQLWQHKKAKSTELNAGLTVKRFGKVGLQYYSAKQNKSGVSYNISAKGGRRTQKGAFMGPIPGAIALKLNGGVFKRVGKKRTPIVKLHGPSPWAVFDKAKLKARTERQIFYFFRREAKKKIKQLKKQAKK
jgi:hypothetical protein